MREVIKYSWVLALCLSLSWNSNAANLTMADLAVPQMGHPTEWYFHSGEGFTEVEYRDPDSGELTKLRSPCELSRDNPQCMEKVFYFSKTAILQFVNAARDYFDQKWQMHTGYAVAAGTAAFMTGKGAAATTGMPVVSVGLWVTTGILGIVAAYEGYKVGEALYMLGQVDDLIAEEEAYVRRCGHMRKDFLRRASELGVKVVFDEEYGGQFVDSSHYLDGVKKEKEKLDYVLQMAAMSGMTSREAYEKLFLTSCDALPTRNWTPIDELFGKEWDHVSENIKRKSLKVARRMNLKNGGGIEFSNFGSRSFNSTKEQSSALDFLVQLDHAISRAERYAELETREGEIAKAALEYFRTAFDGIIVEPRWTTANSKYYEVKSINGRNYLYFYLHWQHFVSAYSYKVDPYFKEELSIPTRKPPTKKQEFLNKLALEM